MHPGIKSPPATELRAPTPVPPERFYIGYCVAGESPRDCSSCPIPCTYMYGFIVYTTAIQL